MPSLNWLREVREFANQHKLRVHIDAARGFNAAVHLGYIIIPKFDKIIQKIKGC